MESKVGAFLQNMNICRVADFIKVQLVYILYTFFIVYLMFVIFIYL